MLRYCPAVEQPAVLSARVDIADALTAKEVRVVPRRTRVIREIWTRRRYQRSGRRGTEFAINLLTVARIPHLCPNTKKRLVGNVDVRVCHLGQDRNLDRAVSDNLIDVVRIALPMARIDPILVALPMARIDPILVALPMGCVLPILVALPMGCVLPILVALPMARIDPLWPPPPLVQKLVSPRNTDTPSAMLNWCPVPQLVPIVPIACVRPVPAGRPIAAVDPGLSLVRHLTIYRLCNSLVRCRGAHHLPWDGAGLSTLRHNTQFGRGVDPCGIIRK